MSNPGVRTYCPEYGSIRTLLLVAVLAATTVVAAPAIETATGSVLVVYALYLVVSAVAVAALVTECQRQSATNPHEFSARQVMATFYEQQRPDPGVHLLHFVFAAAGTAAIALGFEPALSRQEGALLVVERVAAEEPLPPIDPTNVAWGIVLIVGVIFAAVGIDRLLVGAYRELRYQHSRR